MTAITTELGSTDIDALEAVVETMPKDTPFVMVNLLRYRDQADYGERKDFAPRSGRDAYYQGHLKFTLRKVQQLGGRVHWFGHVQTPIFALNDEHWDDVLLVRWPSLSATIALQDDLEYQSTVIHRNAALADRRVFATLVATELDAD